MLFLLQDQVPEERTLEAYIKRLEKLEEIANSYEGVEKSYAIQAGREIRIMINQKILMMQELLKWLGILLRE